jgi:hypothetical protein
MTALRPAAGAGAAVAAIAALLTLPTPHPAPPITAVTPQATAAGQAMERSGLATIWPHAHPIDLPAILPDGSTYAPITILDHTTTIGTAATADGSRYTLIQVTTTGAVRALQSAPAEDSLFINAVTTDPTRIYWMSTTTTSPAGTTTTSLWSAPRDAGPATHLTDNIGTTTFTNSTSDLQVIDSRIHWASADGTNTDLRSVPVTGGPVHTRRIPGQWQPVGWPWLTTPPGAPGAPVQIYNPDTGTRHTATPPAGQMLTCGPTWCRTVAGYADDTSAIELSRVDGTDRQRVGASTDIDIAADVALLDRFEVIATPAPPTPTTVVVTEKVSLYDLAHHRSVLITTAASDAEAHGTYLWWSTGDHETLTWHALDLRTLT